MVRIAPTAAPGNNPFDIRRKYNVPAAEKIKTANKDASFFKKGKRGDLREK